MAVRVSNHAAVRYLTRVKRIDEYVARKMVKYDKKSVAQEMIPPATYKRIDKFQNGRFTVGPYILAVRNGLVRTVLLDLD